jgi:hypothetical protein
MTDNEKTLLLAFIDLAERLNEVPGNKHIIAAYMKIVCERLNITLDEFRLTDSDFPF